MRLKSLFERERVLSALLFLCSVAISLVIAELVLRATLYQNINYERSGGPNSSYRQTTPEFDTLININSLNMRDDEVEEKRANEYRVLCIGDSFTFGSASTWKTPGSGSPKGP